MKKYTKITLEVTLEDIKDLVIKGIQNTQQVTITEFNLKDNILIIDCVGGNHAPESKLDLPIEFVQSENKKGNYIKMPNELKEQIDSLFNQGNNIDLTELAQNNKEFTRHIVMYVNKKYSSKFKNIGKYKYKEI